MMSVHSIFLFYLSGFLVSYEIKETYSIGVMQEITEKRMIKFPPE